MSANTQAMAPAIDLAEAARFFDLMAEGEQVTFQTFDDDKGKRGELVRQFHGGIDEDAESLAALNAAGAGVFWMVNRGDGKGRAAANVQSVRALFVDLDGAPLAPVLQAGAEPHAVIESSPGKWHVYWLVTGCDLVQFGPAQRSLAARFGGDATVHDLPRVLRVPGFLHQKSDTRKGIQAAPFMSRIVSMEQAQAYPFGDLVQRLALVSAPTIGAGTVAARIPEQASTPAPADATEWADDRTIADLRGALASLNADDRGAWIENGHRLRGLGAAGLALWLQWSATSQKFDERDARQRWQGFARTATGYRAVFAAAQAAGWVNPASTAAGAALVVDKPRPAPWRTVDVHDLDTAVLPHQVWLWEGYIPAGAVTMLGAHGGTGKSWVALMLATCTALGLALFGVPTTPARVVFFSAEDDADTVRRRLQTICLALGVSAALLRDRLRVLDATEEAPELYGMTFNDEGIPRLGATQAAHALHAYIAEVRPGLLIVDNASDTMGGNENARPEVRAFVRLLAGMVRGHGGAVLLLAHLDKSAAKGFGGGESYSGSTAWHNSARSRLTLKRDKGTSELTLEHEKSNYGPLCEPLRLSWPRDGLPQLDAPLSGVVHAIATSNGARALLRLVHEFTTRGEFVSTAATGPACMTVALKHAEGYPKRMQPGEVIEAMRGAERRGHVERVAYLNAARKPRERWQVTPAGMQAAEIAPVAPVAPVLGIGATSATGNRAAPVAPVPASGGVGGEGGAETGATTGAEVAG